MYIILWSVIRDQWFSKIEVFKFFLKICQPLEISLRSAIRDPQLIFVFWLRETFWQDWYAYDSVICDPWSVIFKSWIFKKNSQNLPAFRILAAICDLWSATNICILIKRDFLARLYSFNSVIRDPWSVTYEIEFFKFFSKFASV